VVEFWRMGPTPVPVRKIGAFAHELESIGWDGLAVGENNKQPDPYAVLATAAAATTTLRLGTATAVPIRHPLQAAVAMATVQGLAEGRARFTLGRGDSAAKALQEEPMPVSAFERYLDRLRRYLHREEVDINGTASTISALSVIDPSIDVSPPPIDAAATGPKMIEAALRSCDSVDVAVGADVTRLAATLEKVRAASQVAGRDFADVRPGCFVQLAVSEGDDLAQVRNAIRPLAMTFARFSAYNGKPLADVDEADRQHLRHAGEVLDAKFTSTVSPTAKLGAPPGELDFFRADGAGDDAFIDRFAIVGPAEACAERLQQLIDLGFERIYIGTRFMGTDVAETNTRKIARDVFPMLRPSSITV